MDEPVIGFDIFWGKFDGSGCIPLDTGIISRSHECREELVDNSNIPCFVMCHRTDDPVFIAGVLEHMAPIQFDGLFQKVDLMSCGNRMLCLLPEKVELLKVSHDMEIMVDLIAVCGSFNQWIFGNQRKCFSECMDISADVGGERIHLFRVIRPQRLNDLPCCVSRFSVQKQICCHSTALRRIEITLFKDTLGGLDLHASEEVDNYITVTLDFIGRQR